MTVQPTLKTINGRCRDMLAQLPRSNWAREEIQAFLHELVSITEEPATDEASKIDGVPVSGPISTFYDREERLSPNNAALERSAAETKNRAMGCSCKHHEAGRIVADDCPVTVHRKYRPEWGSGAVPDTGPTPPQTADGGKALVSTVTDRADKIGCLVAYLTSVKCPVAIVDHSPNPNHIDPTVKIDFPDSFKDIAKAYLQGLNEDLPRSRR